MPPVKIINTNTCTASGDTRQATGRVGYNSGSEVNPRGERLSTVKYAGGTSEGMDPGGKMLEGPRHTTVRLW